MNASLLLQRSVLGAMFLGLAAGPLTCAQPECVVPDYRDPECRVIVEGELARLRAAVGVELRFHDPEVADLDTWDALGLLREHPDGRIRARLAGLGDFLISVRSAADQPPQSAQITLELHNVDPAALLTVDPPTALLAAAPPALLTRELTLQIVPGERVTVRGARPCPQRYHLAFVGDIQTNPLQFERILAKMAEDAQALAAAGEPLLGLVVVGDLTEWSYEVEFAQIAEILARAPAPAAVTAGNHDIFRKIVATYNMTFGPANYSSTICGVRLALLDSGSAGLARSIEGRLPELLDRRGQPHLIAATHIAPYAGLTGDGWVREDQADMILAELALQRADLLIAGHSHALIDYPRIEAGAHQLREIIVGTGGASQGVGVARFGYLLVRVGERLDPCFVEVPPPGWSGPANRPLSAALPYCDDLSGS